MWFYRSSKSFIKEKILYDRLSAVVISIHTLQLII